MKKLTYNEILEILKDKFDVSEFATEDVSAPDDFTNSPEVQKLLDDHNQAYNNLIEHPDYNKRRDDQSDDFVRVWDIYRNCTNPYDRQFNEYLDSIGLGELTVIDRHGGEGQGDNWWKVFYFNAHDVYIKIEGWYSSGHGTDFEDWDEACKEVRPIEKTITVYE